MEALHHLILPAHQSYHLCVCDLLCASSAGRQGPEPQVEPINTGGGV